MSEPRNGACAGCFAEDATETAPTAPAVRTAVLSEVFLMGVAVVSRAASQGAGLSLCRRHAMQLASLFQEMGVNPAVAKVFVLRDAEPVDDDAVEICLTPDEKKRIHVDVQEAGSFQAAQDAVRQVIGEEDFRALGKRTVVGFVTVGVVPPEGRFRKVPRPS
jgi:hypothetical protein